MAALLVTKGVLPACGQKTEAVLPETEMLALQKWQAGSVVSERSVQVYGLQRCFCAQPVPDAVWSRMQGKSYRPNPHIGRDDLRYLQLLHWDGDGRLRLGEMVCNRVIAKQLVDIFRKLYEARYPIERMVLPDVCDADDERQMQANNTSCFCYRQVAGSQKLSKHARGLAVDLNPLYNPYFRVRADGTRFVQPSTALRYCDRRRSFPCKITRSDLACRLFRQHGFEWGGDWTTCKDYQHFEFTEKQ